MVKYLVTGGCGFIGSHLSEELLKKGDAVRILDDLSSGREEHIPNGAELIIGSITDPECWKRALEGVDGCFHLAAIPSVERSIRAWSETHATNSVGMIHLFEQLKKPIPIIYASSAAVYGNGGEERLSENLPPNPLSPYAADKLSCELHARLAFELFGIPSLGFRFFNVFGPRQGDSPYSGVITLFVDKITRGEPITIFGDGEQRRDFIFVGDVVRILIEAMMMPIQKPDIFNICTGKSVSINKVADEISELVNLPVTKRYGPPREGDIRFSCGDPTKTEMRFGKVESIPFKEGLALLLEKPASHHNLFP